DQTVLANEQVINGCCERCGSQVTKKELEQWYFLTTKMAEELLEGLEEVEWPEHVKTLQRNWIGRSDGAMVSFAIGDDEKIEVFTTRPDTLFGVTAIVLAPEHPLAKELCAQNGKKGEFEAYYQAVSAKTNVDRSQAKETEKTALFTGASVAHPFTDEKLPVWIADYVLMEYGTGAVMAVPAHDERDYMFAKAHDLPIKQVIATETPLPYSGTGNLVSSSPYDGQPSAEAAERIVADLESTEKGKFTTTYRLRDWLVSRQRYWGAPIPIVYDPDGKPHPVKDEHLPLLLPEDTDILPGGKSPLERSIAYKKRAEELYGVGWHFDTDTLDTFVDSSWYFLRYLSPIDKNQAFDKDLVKKWLPVDLYIGGIEHATLHLLYARFMYRFLVQNGYVKTSQSEPFKKLFNIGMINMHGAKMSKSKGNVVSPDPLIEHYGTDALRGYELFIGPLDVEAEWSPNGINGVHRFLIKLCNITVNDEDILFSRNLFNTYLYKIEQSIATFRLNTVISTAMEFINEAVKAGVDKETMQKFIITLSPVFPYLCEEIWSNLGGTNSVFNTKWPKRFIFQGAENLDRWKLLKNQKFVTTFTVPAGAIPSNTAIENKANSLGIKFNNYFINHENKVINLIVS
ncbi:MAG: class I tRNA ligase family protein, partial [Patescibacteria group bacterium]